MFREVGYALYKRALVDDGGNGEVPPPSSDNPHQVLAVFIFLFNILVLLPVIIIVHYSFKMIYPVLAMIEDETPPAYEPVPLNEDVAPVPGAPKPLNSGATGEAPHQAITSSMRRIHRVLKANGGVRSYARGLACMLAHAFLTMLGLVLFVGVVNGLHIPQVLAPVVAPLASFGINMALCQFSTAWVHIVISKPSPLHFWSRLPEFRRTYDATWRPTILVAVAGSLAYIVPSLTASALHVKLGHWDPNTPWEVPANSGAGWKVVVVTLVSLALAVFVTIPSYVVLVRVQASLLPEEDETIVPFDRSFQGKVEPAVIGGKGYVSIRDAWATFSNAAWRRLLILYVKVSVLVAFFTVTLLFLVLFPEFLLLARK